MCISASISISTFFISIISAWVLANYGNRQYKTENIIVAIFSVYIAIVQLFEFFIWIDIDNRYGINRLISHMLPIYVYLEPLALINLQLWIYQLPFTPLMAIYQLLYITFIATKYNYYISHDIVTTTCNHGILDWKWISKYPFGEFLIDKLYYATFLYGMFAYVPFTIGIIIFLFVFSINIIALSTYKQYFGSFFCFLGAFVPIIVLLCELFI